MKTANTRKEIMKEGVLSMMMRTTSSLEQNKKPTLKCKLLAWNINAWRKFDNRVYQSILLQEKAQIMLLQ